MIARTLQAKVLVFAVFFIGIATGVLIANFYDARVTGSRTETVPSDRAQKAQRDISKFHDYLGLNGEQRDQVNKILEDTRHEFQELRKETQPKFQAIQQASRGKIRELLTEEQRKKYDEFRRRQDERMKNRGRDAGRDREANRDRGQRPN